MKEGLGFGDGEPRGIRGRRPGRLTLPSGIPQVRVIEQLGSSPDGKDARPKRHTHCSVVRVDQDDRFAQYWHDPHAKTAWDSKESTEINPSTAPCFVRTTTQSSAESEDGAGVGKYTMLGSLGAGSSSRVYRAQRQHDGLHVAVKLMNSCGDDWECLARQEFEMLRSLKHPNIIEVLEFIPAGSFEPAGMVLELFDGQDLKKALRASGPLRADRALSLFTQLLESLAYLHARNIIHRDVKAENMLVAPDFGLLKLTDFNVAACLQDPDLTPMGMSSYVSPEVRAGELPGTAHDIWAAGLCFNLMLHARLNFDRSVVARPENEQWPKDHQVSMEAICNVALCRSLQADKERRAKASSLLEDLRGYLRVADHDVNGSPGPSSPC